MDFNSITDVELLFQDMECRDVHLAHEVRTTNSLTDMLMQGHVTLLNKPPLA
jgi:hypothetical protein